MCSSDLFPSHDNNAHSIKSAYTLSTQFVFYLVSSFFFPSIASPISLDETTNESSSESSSSILLYSHPHIVSNQHTHYRHSSCFIQFLHFSFLPLHLVYNNECCSDSSSSSTLLPSHLHTTSNQRTHYRYNTYFIQFLRFLYLRPYHVEYNSSRPFVFFHI